MTTGPETFGKYEILARLAVGGMGETLLAQLHGAAGVTKRVVIKKLLPQAGADPAAVEAFIQEARISTTLSHGNIAHVFDFGEIDGQHYLAMEYVHGCSLQKVAQRAREKLGPGLPLPVATYIVIELLKALHYAHTRTRPDGRPLSLVHRDVSPQNVLVSFEGEVKLVDFGVAKASIGHVRTEPGQVKGKYRYLSPEQAQGQSLDARSDIFSAGIVLYELLTGVSPFKGSGYDVMLDIVKGEPDETPLRAPEIPPELAEVALTALKKKPEDRFPTALAMQEALARWLFRQSSDLSSEVVRELMGQLFGDELANQGTPFVPLEDASKVLRALQQTTHARAVEAKPDRRSWLAAAVLVLLGGAGLAGVLSTLLTPSVDACARAGDASIAAHHLDEAIAKIDECLAGRPPSFLVDARKGNLRCQQQNEDFTNAEAAMGRGELDDAARLLAAPPLDCGRTRHATLSAELRRARERLQGPAAGTGDVTPQQVSWEEDGGSDTGLLVMPKPNGATPGSPDDYIMKAQMMLNVGNYKLAKVTLQDCVKHHPAFAQCHTVLGAVMYRMREAGAENELVKGENLMRMQRPKAGNVAKQNPPLE
jgi:hypothetical protein